MNIEPRYESSQSIHIMSYQRAYKGRFSMIFLKSVTIAFWYKDTYQSKSSDLAFCDLDYSKDMDYG